MKPARAAVVVLNWNNFDDTNSCLQSLAAGTTRPTIVLVDNGSTDGSCQRLEVSGLPDVVLRTDANLGYAGGNNHGIRWALEHGFEQVIVLNNDTLVEADMVARLLTRMDEAPNAAISPRIRHIEDDQVWFAGGVIDKGWPRHLQPDELAGVPDGLRSTDWLSGCCIGARAATWRRVGLFDERYFLIFEDCDWSMRALRAGVRLYVADDARLAHKVSLSFRSGPSSRLSTYYFTRNGLKFHSRWQRRHLTRFVRQRVAAPMWRGLRGEQPIDEGLMALSGFLAAVTLRGGIAGTPVTALAQYLCNHALSPDVSRAG